MFFVSLDVFLLLVSPSHTQEPRLLAVEARRATGARGQGAASQKKVSTGGREPMFTLNTTPPRIIVGNIFERLK